MGTDDRRQPVHRSTRGHARRAWNVAFKLVRWIGRRARSVYATFGLFILVGTIGAVALTFAFAKLAARVAEGQTLPFDERVMRFLATHQIPWLTAASLEVTSLGTGLVVAVIIGVSCLFLWLYDYKSSAQLLLVATLGGILLNNVLKFGFDRPRPRTFTWATTASSSSFPSGHAMSAAVVYTTIAYLAMRLEKTALARVLTMAVAALLIVLISLSRVYLGVHYPSDVAAGVIVGVAWSGFCMMTLEIEQLYAQRNAPALIEGEHPPTAAGILVAGTESILATDGPREPA